MPIVESFASITSLASAFTTGRDVNKVQASLDEFRAWLQAQGYDEQRQALQSCHSTTIYVKAILNQELPKLFAALNGIEHSYQGQVKSIAALAKLSQEVLEQGAVILEKLLAHSGDSGNRTTQNTSGDNSHNLHHSGTGDINLNTGKQTTNNIENKGPVFNQQQQTVKRDQYNIAGDAHIYPNKNTLPKQLSQAIPKLNNLQSIIGRDTELTQLRKNLNDDEQVVLVNGLGGIGKTALAQAYLTQHWESYQHIIWLHCDEQRGFLQALVSAEGVKENLGITATGDMQTTFSQILSGLNALSARPNLLVIDDAQEDLQQCQGYLPKAPQWHVLLTSRTTLAGFAQQNLEFLSTAHAIALFKQHYTLGDLSDEQIQSLVELVDHHTLSIEILAKAANRHFVDLETLKTAIEDDLKAGVYIEHNQKTERIERVRSYLSSIFKAQQLAKDEQWLLGQLACLPADFHGFTLLKALINPAASNKEDSFSDTLRQLQEKGWLLYSEENRAFKLHAIIARVVLEQLPTIIPENTAPLIQAVTKKLAYDPSKDNPIQSFPWVPFGQSLAGVFKQSCHRDYAFMLDRLATSLQNMGNYDAALTYQQWAVNSEQQSAGEDSTALASYRANLGVTWQYKGEYAKAIEYYQLALASDLKTYGEGHPDVAIRRNNLGSAYKSLGEHAKAIEYYQLALASDLETYGEGHPQVAIYRNNLGLAYNSLGEYAKAIEYYQLALASDLKTYGEGHPSVAIRRNNLGLAYDSLGEYAKAIEYFKLALASDLKTYGEGHPSVAIRRNNLGNAYDSLGEYAKAIEYYQLALASFIKTYGESHPNVATLRNNLGSAYDSLGEHAKAIEYYQLALASDLKTYGEGHPSVARRRNNLGMAYKSLGEYAKAIEYYQLALASFIKTYGEDHPNVATLRNNLGSAYDSLGEYTKAIEYYELALASDLKTYGEGHPQVAIYRNNLGSAYYAQGDYQAALPHFETALKIRLRMLGEAHPNTKATKEWLEACKEKLK